MSQSSGPKFLTTQRRVYTRKIRKTSARIVKLSMMASMVGPRSALRHARDPGPVSGSMFGYFRLISESGKTHTQVRAGGRFARANRDEGRQGEQSRKMSRRSAQTAYTLMSRSSPAYHELTISVQSRRCEQHNLPNSMFVTWTRDGELKEYDSSGRYAQPNHMAWQ